MGTSIRSISRLVAWLVCVILAFSPGAGVPLPGASQRSPENAVDFAAMTLTPEDLSDAGLDDFRLVSGHVMYFDDAVTIIAEDAGMPEDEVADQLADFGFAYWYQSELYLPPDENEAGGLPEREVYSYVVEFADDDQAADAWDILQDESADPSAEDLADAEEFGDLSEATMYLAEDPETGVELPVLDLAFLMDNLMVGVRLFQRDGDEPALRDGEALAEIMEERVDDVLDDGGPGLSRQALRLDGDEVVSSVDNYLLLDAEVIQFYHETRRDSRDRENEAEEIGQTDEYAVWQQLAALEEGQVDDVWYMMTIRRFDRQRDAEDWLDGFDSEVEDNPAYANFQVDEQAPEFGDQSLSFSMEWAEGPISYRGIAIRIDDTIATIYLQGPEAPPADAVEELADAQVECMEDGCDEPMELPGPLEDYIDGLGSLPLSGMPSIAPARSGARA